jgi:hypothetical protein
MGRALRHEAALADERVASRRAAKLTLKPRPIVRRTAAITSRTEQPRP